MYDDNRNVYELEYPAPVLGQRDNADEPGPTMIVALEGHFNAGHAVEGTADYLRAVFDSRLVASFNVDELLNYGSKRPTVTIDPSSEESVSIPKASLELNIMRDSNNTPFLLLSGNEPDLRWEAFSQAVADLVEKYDVAQTFCLYAIDMVTPHTRPMVIDGRSNTPALVSRVFQLPTPVISQANASMYLESTLNERGRAVAGLTAHIPQYVSGSYYPPATYHLLQQISAATSLTFPMKALDEDIRRFRKELSEAVAESEEIQGVIAHFERQYDEFVENYRSEHPAAILPGEEPVASGEEIGAEFQRFLAELDSPRAESEDHRAESEDHRGEAEDHRGEAEPDHAESEEDRDR